MNGELLERHHDAIGHPFRLSGVLFIQLSWRFASPDQCVSRCVWDRVHLWSSRPNFERIMLRVVSERGLLHTLRSRGDFATGLVILRAVGMLIVGSLPLLSLWFQAGAEHLYVYIFQ